MDGEAWIQPPGVIRISHKNRAQMLTRDKVNCIICFLLIYLLVDEVAVNGYSISRLALQF